MVILKSMEMKIEIHVLIKVVVVEEVFVNKGDCYES